MTSQIAFKSLRLAAGAVLGAAALAPALAQSPAQGLLDSRFVFNAGGFVVGSNIKANLNGQSSNNPEIDFDETFGRASDGVRARVDALWRINPRHHLRFLYFDNSNDKTRTLDEDVAWGDYIFKAGSSVTAKRSFEVYELAYEYAFVRQPTYEVAATLGVHATDLRLQLSGQADVLDPDGNVVRSEFSTKSGDALAPLPVIGIRAGWVVAPQWYIDAQAQVFSLDSGSYSGRWTDFRVGAVWMFHKNVGLGLGYNSFYTKVDVDEKNYSGRVKLGYSGLLAYLSATF